MEKSLQAKYASNSICYGCGPANPNGLHLASYVDGSDVIAQWTPSAHHHAFPGVVNGGIIGSILDCHCNWTAAWALMKAHQHQDIPCTVTAEYTIKLRRPTPMGKLLCLRAKCVNITGQRAHIEATLCVEGIVTARASGQFVAVTPNHPAHHRWQRASEE